MGTVKTFGERLKQLRREKSAVEERDVGQGDVVTATGVSQANLSRYERAVHKPDDLDAVKALAAYYKVNWIWLLHGEGEKYAAQPPVPRKQVDRTDLARRAAETMEVPEAVTGARRSKRRRA